MQHRCRIDSIRLTVIIQPALNIFACSKPTDWLYTSIPTTLCMKSRRKKSCCVPTLSSAASQPAKSQPTSIVFECLLPLHLAATLPEHVGASAWHWGRAFWHWVTGGILSTLLSLRPPHRIKVVCHPVPIDSTRGCCSAVLFIGLSLPWLLPWLICVTVAQWQQI